MDNYESANINVVDVQKNESFASTIDSISERLKKNASAIRKEGLTPELSKNILEISRYLSQGVELKSFEGYEMSVDSFLPESEKIIKNNKTF